MDILQSIITARVIFILGIVNIVLSLMIVGSCRCIPGSKLAGRLMNLPAYKNFFKYHCYLWWLFWPSVIVHAGLALVFFGWPS